jgi:nitrous-oxide reductase
MSDKKDSLSTETAGIGRRRFINTAALAGLPWALPRATTSPRQPLRRHPLRRLHPRLPPAQRRCASTHLKPGELDTYYGLWSGGHTGDVRVLGLPSGREINRIPCFVPDCMVGWGITNESKAIMGTKADGSLKYTWPTPTTPRLLQGRQLRRPLRLDQRQDQRRIARIRLDYFVCDKITELPNVQGFHGIFPDKRDPVDPAINYTTRVFCGGEFASRCPTTAASRTQQVPLAVHLRRRRDHGSALAGADRRQLRPGRHLLRRQAGRHQPVQHRDGRHYEDMMSAERDACLFFNVARIEEAVKDGKFKTIGDQGAGGGRHPRSQQGPKTALTAYVPVPRTRTASTPARTASTSSAPASSRPPPP